VSKRVRRDFTVIPTAKRYSVHGRLSEWDGEEWHWIDGWHVGTYRTREKAQIEADRLNRCPAIAKEKSL
jgi:hypothetical protein